MVAIVGAIDLTCAQTLAATLGLGKSVSLAIFAAVIASHAAINALSVKLVAKLNDFSATVHIVGVVVLVIALVAIGGHHGASYAFDTSFTARKDGAYGIGFVSSLVLGMWTFTGYDASAHAAEETHDPARRAPWGIVSSVVVSALAGYALAIALTLAIDSLPDAAADSASALFVVKGALGGGWGRGAMGLVIAAMWFCGLSSLTSASRMLYAFARDDGLPLARALRKVSPTLKTPVNATFACAALPCALIFAIAPFDEAVFLAVATLATIGFYAAYALPIVLGACARARGTWKHRGPWNVGAFGAPVAWVATLWSLFVIGVCIFANHLAGEIFAGVAIVLAALYFTVVRGKFRGPKIRLAAIEEA
jgi:amino acid transporter